jgi:nitroreductase
MEKWKNRLAENPVDPEFIARVSTRAFDPNKSIDQKILASCFEAARWAPSCYNNQPWRYLWAKKGSATYQAITDSMIEFNRIWCKNVPILVVICTRKAFIKNAKPSVTASLDTGASYMSLVLQAHKYDLATHAMDGFDREKLRKSLSIPDVYHLEALLALGYPGPLNVIPEEIQSKETPTERMPLSQIVSENDFHFM